MSGLCIAVRHSVVKRLKVIHSLNHFIISKNLIYDYERSCQSFG